MIQRLALLWTMSQVFFQYSSKERVTQPMLFDIKLSRQRLSLGQNTSDVTWSNHGSGPEVGYPVLSNQSIFWPILSNQSIHFLGSSQ